MEKTEYQEQLEKERQEEQEHYENIQREFDERQRRLDSINEMLYRDRELKEEQKRKLQQQLEKAYKEQEKLNKMIERFENEKKHKYLSETEPTEAFERGQEVKTEMMEHRRNEMRMQDFEHSAPNRRAPEDYDPRDLQTPEWKVQQGQERQEADRAEYNEYNQSMREMSGESKEQIPVEEKHQEKEYVTTNTEDNIIKNPEETEEQRKERERNETRESIPNSDDEIKKDKQDIEVGKLRNKEFESDFKERSAQLRRDMEKEYGENWEQEDRYWQELDKKENKFFDNQRIPTSYVNQKRPEMKMERLYLTEKEMNNGYIRFNGQKIEMDKDTIEYARSNSGRAYLLTTENGKRKSVEMVNAETIDNQNVKSPYEKALEASIREREAKISGYIADIKTQPEELKQGYQELINKEKNLLEQDKNQLNALQGKEHLNPQDLLKKQRAEQAGEMQKGSTQESSSEQSQSSGRSQSR